MNFHIITLFPESLESYMQSSILGRAIAAKKISVQFYNPRDFTKDKHRKADDRAYGGGPGMVMKAEPLLDAVKFSKGRKKNVKIILFSPSGKKFTNVDAETFSKKYRHIILICGHYEGIDARVKKILKAEDFSIGDYVLTGGEIPAAVIVDAISRKIPGVLGNADSLEDIRIASPEVYTRPEVLNYNGKNYRVPKVLLSGHHKNIDDWREGKRRKK